jgi:poly-gamma-glutamate synthesis protein (capsule biosynthesis protein)
VALVLDEDDLKRVAREIQGTDAAIKIITLHAGGNWGWSIEQDTQMVCRRLIDAGADFIHGHSSHHARRAELYRGRLILFGCGELLNDYEGIVDHRGFPSHTFNADLRYAYFPTLKDDGEFVGMRIDVFRQANCFCLERATYEATQRAFRSLVADYRTGGLAMSLEGTNTLVVEPLANA